jgi:hypothetical protein
VVKRLVLLVLVLLFAGIFRNVLAEDPVSPLFQERLAATLAGWEGGSDSRMAEDAGPPWWPASVNPASFCAGSVCLASYCLGSACISSECIGSGCVGSACLGSGCASSLCLGSGCLGSMCAGSACLGPSLCPRHCDDPTNPISPDYPSLTGSPTMCPVP